MEQDVIKGSTGVSIGLVVSIIGTAIAVFGLVVGYIFLKCKSAWVDADRKIELGTDGKIKLVDDKIGSRVREIYARIDREKDLTDEKIREEVNELQLQHNQITETVTKAISDGFEKVHEKMDSMTTQIHKIDKRVAVIESNSGRRRNTDNNNGD